MVIDFHIHMSDPKLMAKAPPPSPDGPKMAMPKGPVPKTPEEVKKNLQEMGISHAVVQHMSIRPGGTKEINEFAKELYKNYDGFFFQYGGFHPDDDPDDLKELKESGAFQGIKLHPYLQRFVIDDPKMYPAYEMMSSLGLPVLFHTGRDFSDPSLRNAFPEKILKIHKDFPKLQIVASHLGAFCMYDEAEEMMAGQDLFIDVTASVTFCKDPEQYKRIVLKHDPDKILFGSDYAMGDPAKELEYLQSLNLSSDLMDKILYQNAQRLLGIK